MSNWWEKTPQTRSDKSCDFKVYKENCICFQAERINCYNVSDSAYSLTGFSLLTLYLKSKLFTDHKAAQDRETFSSYTLGWAAYFQWFSSWTMSLFGMKIKYKRSTNTEEISILVITELYLTDLNHVQSDFYMRKNQILLHVILSGDFLRQTAKLNSNWYTWGGQGDQPLFRIFISNTESSKQWKILQLSKK